MIRNSVPALVLGLGLGLGPLAIRVVVRVRVKTWIRLALGWRTAEVRVRPWRSSRPASG